MTTHEQCFEDGSDVARITHDDGHTQVIWRVRTPDGRLELLEWWNPSIDAAPTTLEGARDLVKQLGGWDKSPWTEGAT